MGFMRLRRSGIEWVVKVFFVWFGNWFCRHVWGSLRCACIGTVVPVDLLALWEFLHGGSDSPTTYKKSVLNGLWCRVFGEGSTSKLPPFPAHPDSELMPILPLQVSSAFSEWRPYSYNDLGFRVYPKNQMYYEALTWTLTWTPMLGALRLCYCNLQ